MGLLLEVVFTIQLGALALALLGLCGACIGAAAKMKSIGTADGSAA